MQVTLAGVLDDQLTEALRRCTDETLQRHQSPSAPVPVVDAGTAFADLADRLEALAPVVRSELGLDHFVVGGVSATLSRIRRHECNDVGVAAESPGRPRLGFVGSLGSRDGSSNGDGSGKATLRVLDEDWTEIELADDTLVVFPADRHHEITACDPPGDVAHYRVSGFITGATLAGDGLDLDGATRNRLQQHYLPRLSEQGYEVRPIPGPIFDFLTAIHEIRRDRATTEQSESFRPTGDADFIDVHDLGDDLLRWMQPLHESFAGVPLVPSNVYGIRSYREGNTLEMHLDRPEALITSSILQIAQDVDEPWPLMIERDGRRRDIVLEPGQMLFYEGATTLHGRPRPLAGRSFANLFVHYRPVDWRWDGARIAQQALADGLVDAFGRPTDRFEEYVST